MSARAPHLVIYLGLAFAAFILGTTTVVAWSDYRQAMDAAARRTEEHVRLLEAHARRLLDGADAALRQAAEIAADPDAAPRLQRLVEPLPHVAALWIEDPSGRIVAGSAPGAPPPGLAPEGLAAVPPIAGDHRAVGRPVLDPASGETLVALARTIHRPDGTPAGTAVAALRAARLRQIRELLRPPDLLVEIARRDGTPILQSPRALPGGAAYYPPPEGAPAGDASVGPRRAAGADGIDRLLTSIPVQGYPLTVTVGVATARIAHGWAGRWAVSFAVALGATLGVASLTWLAWRRAVSEDFVKAALRASERRFRAIFSNALQFTALLEPDGTIIEANQAAVAVIGRPHDEVIDGIFCEMAVWEAGRDGAARMRQRVRLAAAGETIREPVEIRTEGGVGQGGVGQGGVGWLDFSIRPILDEAGRVVQLLAEGRDVTEQRRAEAIAVQAQKMEAVGHLTGGVAHDFNNLLTVIQGNAELLKRRLAGGELARQVAAVERAAARGASLTRQLLAFSRRQPLQPERVDLPERMRDVAELVDRTLGADVDIELDLPGDLWPVEVDPAQLELAVLNIAVNARDAMPDGGTLRIAARNVAHAADEFVALTLADTGSGIDPAFVGRVFEPFFTTKEVGKGTGLGLSQVYGFARQSGGDVRLDSRPGHGTSVTLLLPRAGRRGPGGGGGAPRPHVLVVEDNAEVAQVATLFLDQLGYRASVAGSADAALERLAAGAAPDLVFADIVLPGELSGLDLARRVRTRHPSLPVLLTTGFSEAARDAAAIGVQILVKPYTLTALDGALRRCLKAAAGAAGPRA